MAVPRLSHARAGCTRAVDALLDTLGRSVNALRIGPVCDGDPTIEALLARPGEGGRRSMQWRKPPLPRNVSCAINGMRRRWRLMAARRA
ncbi:hypothetical protein ACXKGW_29155, partial [Klebsiella pneumoniae subsp. pneumoniae]